MWRSGLIRFRPDSGGLQLPPCSPQRHGVRLLGADDLDEFLALAAKDPMVDVFADSRARTSQLLPRWLRQ